MLKRINHHINTICERIDLVAKDFQSRMDSNEIVDEEDITSRFLHTLESELQLSERDLELKSKLITVKKVKEEPRVGADALIVISFQSPEINFCKGLLVQAKKLKLNYSVSPWTDQEGLLKQCDDMLAITPESFVWSYDPSGFRVHRAFMVRASSTRRIDQLSSMTMKGFFAAFLKCYNGDPNLTISDAPRLAKIISDLGIQNVFTISATAEREEPYSDKLPVPEGPPELDGLEKEIFRNSNQENQRTRLQEPLMPEKSENDWLEQSLEEEQTINEKVAQQLLRGE